jgi:hypothetical protein
LPRDSPFLYYLYSSSVQQDTAHHLTITNYTQTNQLTMKIIILSSTLLLLVSCINQQKEKGETAKTIAKSLVSCYGYIHNNDTVVLKIVFVGDSVRGPLVYKLNEKDKNVGTIMGHMKGDLLIADYTFLSEGVSSVRQVAFKKMNGNFVEGYGETVDQNGKMVFKDIDALDFLHSIPLKENDCLQ